MIFNQLANNKKASYYKENYEAWKKQALSTTGYFIVFNTFQKNSLLAKINGNALRLYIYLGLCSDNYTGECWVTIETIATYFDKSTRTISYWIRDLEKLNLVKRFQLDMNKPSHTYLQPYSIEE